MALEAIRRTALLCRHNSKRISLEHLRLCSFALKRLYSSNANDASAANPVEINSKNRSTLQHDSDALSENDRVSGDFVNRNPRNLEKMAIAIKDKGWGMNNFHQKYWHMLHFESDTRETECYLEHRNGFKVIRTSTREWGIRKFLYSSSDVAASYNIGRVMAHRCLQSGIDHVCWETKEPRTLNETIEAFLKGMTEGGVVLEEPEPYDHWTKPDDYFPDYLGKEHKEDLQRVASEWEGIRDKEFNKYEDQDSQAKIEQNAR